jgi:hypothetical protein
MEVASRYALTNRLDLMNIRAELVDSWRKIAVAANSLLGTFNVEYHMESSTPPGQARPLAFSGSRTQHQLILNGQLPLVRKLERNNYRATLIAYQRQRRALMEAEDQILLQIRTDLRLLRSQAQNYNEIQKGKRQNLDLAYFQLGLASEYFFQPPTPIGPSGVPGMVGSPVTSRSQDQAGLIQQLLNALSSLLSVKNELYRVWTDYQINRLALYRDLELMPLDFRGVWIDDPAANCPGEKPGPVNSSGNRDGQSSGPGNPSGREARDLTNNVPGPGPDAPAPSSPVEQNR